MNTERTFNIIWLDDEIEEYQEYQGYEDPSKEDSPKLNFTFIKYKDSFLEKFSASPHKYHAAILDANGLDRKSPADKANKNGFSDLIDLVAEKDVLLYVFSGELERQEYNGEDQDYLNSIKKRIGGEEHFHKKSATAERLLNKIIDDLDSKYHYYLGHEHLLDFFSKGWIQSKFKSEFLDNLMEYYYNKDYDSAHGNHMRNMTEQLLLRVNEEFELVTNLRKEDPSYYSNIAKAIKLKKLDESETISGPLLHMIELSNARSHSALPEDVRKLYFDSDYATFFIVTDWFNRLMSRVEQARTLPTDKEDVIDAQKLQESKGAQLTTRQPQIQRPKTHERTRTGVVVPTYKEGNRTFCDLKVEIPPKWKNYSELYITGVSPNTDPSKKAVWFPYCEEVPEDENKSNEISRLGFNWADIAKISKLKK